MTHYYSEKQKSPLNLKKINIRLKTTVIELYSASGVFSKDKVDKGSKLLIENAIIDEDTKILDFGCGIGVVGISLKLSNPSISVTMLDVNKRAVKISKMNVKLHKLNAMIVKDSNLYLKVEGKFDSILVNPPQTAGKELCMKIISESVNYLTKNGTFQLVARHNKGGSEFEKRMQKIFGNVKQIAKGSGFRVYISKFLPKES
jgi:16S rRNA (guanine1207-N2)-methyltransferase